MLQCCQTSQLLFYKEVSLGSLYLCQVPVQLIPPKNHRRREETLHRETQEIWLFPETVVQLLELIY